MIGLRIDVELVDGAQHQLDVTWGVAYRWQLSHPNSSVEAFAEKRSIDEMVELAWEAAKTAGLNPEPVHQWVDKIAKVKFSYPKAEA